MLLWAMPRGFTLIETLVVIAVLAILASAAGPRFSALIDRQRVGAAAQSVVDAHNRARIRAVLDGRVTQLVIQTDSLVISETSTPGALWRGPGPSAQGVALTGPAHSLLFAPTGIAMGASNGTYTLTRGSAVRQVIISRLGRARIQ